VTQERTAQEVRRDRYRLASPDPAAFASCAALAASGRAASVMSAHTAEKVISVVTAAAAGQGTAAAVALSVVCEALRCSSR
jgi:hypothetical protein